MEWFYLVGDQREGPVADAEFSRLQANGTVTPDTLVWHAGLSEWTPLRGVRPAESRRAAVCSECGRIFAWDELIEFEGQRVCAQCKPAFFQRVKEGTHRSSDVGAIEETLLTLPELLSASWSIFSNNFPTILLLILLTSVPINLVLVAFEPGEEGTLGEAFRALRIAHLLGGTVGVLSMLSIAFVVQEAVAGRETTPGQALRHGLSRWLGAIGTYVVENIIVVFLLLLLVVPGIIWLGYYTFSICVVSLRDRAGKNALDYSKALVQGRWWRVVGFAAAILFIALIPGIGIEASVSLLSSSPYAGVVTSVAVDVLATFWFVTIVVMFLNLDALHRAGRLEVKEK